MEIIIPKPCPLCGNVDITERYNTQYGHGESGFDNLRIGCGVCDIYYGDFFGYGSPSIQDKNKVRNGWNLFVDSIKTKINETD